MLLDPGDHMRMTAFELLFVLRPDFLAIEILRAEYKGVGKPGETL